MSYASWLAFLKFAMMCRKRPPKSCSGKKQRSFYESQLRKIYPVLFESDCKEGMMHGFTPNYIKVNTPFDESFINEIIEVELSEIADDSSVSCRILQSEFAWLFIINSSFSFLISQISILKSQYSIHKSPLVSYHLRLTSRFIRPEYSAAYTNIRIFCSTVFSCCRIHIVTWAKEKRKIRTVANHHSASLER